MELALAEAQDHCELYSAIDGAIRNENAEIADSWVDEAVAFDERQQLDELGRPIVSGPDAIKNPYESRSQSTCSSN